MIIALTGGAYTARSLAASAQRQINLYSEAGPPGSIVELGEQPAAIPGLYPTPGLRALGTPPTPGIARGLYRANSGTLFYVCGSTVYTVAADWTCTSIGTIAAGTGLVSMTDNSLTMVLVDGTANGYQVDLTTLAFSAINSAPYMSDDATNQLLNSATLSTQSVTVIAAPATLSFYGTGSVALSGAFVGNLVGIGAYPARVSLTFTPTAGALTLTVSGSVINAQLEFGTTASAYIATLGSQVTRYGTVTIPPGNAPTVASAVEYAFYGADRVAAIDGYLIFNQPGTRNFYCTQNGSVIFDSLNIAAKNGSGDKLVAAIVTGRTLWLIGEKTCEVWFDAGGADFPFARLDGPFVEHGCRALGSIAQVNEELMFLAQDRTGAAVMVQTKAYAVVRVSTHAIEAEWAGYPTLADAEAFTFQQAGHVFYQISFPAADKTWRFDLATGEWHEVVWLDTNGTHHRHRARCMAWHGGVVVVADWQTGALMALDPKVYTDLGRPIMRLRQFPHMVADGDRVFYRQFVANLETGTGPQ